MKKIYILLVFIICALSGIKGYYFYNQSFFPDFSQFKEAPPVFESWILDSKTLNSVDSNLVFKYRYDAVKNVIETAGNKSMVTNYETDRINFKWFEFIISRRINPSNCFVNHGYTILEQSCSENILSYYLSSGKNDYLCFAWEFDSVTGNMVKNSCKSRLNQIYDNVLYFLKGNSVNLVARAIFPIKKNMDLKKEILNRIISDCRQYLKNELNKNE